MASNALPPEAASSLTTLSRPMTSKNAFGSIPCAELKSVPVFFSEAIAARMPCTAATHETREKTGGGSMSLPEDGVECKRKAH